MASHKETFKVTCNDRVFFFTEDDVAVLDLIQQSDAAYNCLVDHRSVNAVLLESNTADKKFKLDIEGEIFSVQVKDELDQVLEKMGFGLAANKILTNVKAPMPGLVLDIAVTEGQAIKQGDKVLILEAMKMENSIVIAADAVIKKILVKKGQAVEKGQVLVELEG